MKSIYNNLYEFDNETVIYNSLTGEKVRIKKKKQEVDALLSNEKKN